MPKKRYNKKNSCEKNNKEKDRWKDRAGLPETGIHCA